MNRAVRQAQQQQEDRLAAAFKEQPVTYSRSSVELPHMGGIRFRVIARHLRSVYLQIDGSIELADCCTCYLFWDYDFHVVRRMDCPIDEHKLAARRNWEAA